MHAIQDIGENALLEHLARRMPKNSTIVTGIGDDCAVVRAKSGQRDDWLLTSDAVLETVHARPRTAPEALGHKAAGRVLSDLAAMGGEPDWLLVNLTLPPAAPARFIDRFYDGFHRLTRRYGSLAVGGDLSRGPRIAIHVFAVGHVPHGQALLRSGARAGDILYVTGHLGDSLHSGRHLAFEPRLNEGRFLRGWATAAMDISDGLATDLRRLCACSGMDAELHEAALPLAPTLNRYARPGTRQRHALCDGEDYELLFTVPAHRQQAFQKAWRRKFHLPCTAIGTIVKGNGKLWCLGPNGQRQPLAYTGFTHY